MNAWFALAAMIAQLVAAGSAFAAEGGPFARAWSYVSETSAVICWQSDETVKGADAYVEYGPTEQFGSKSRPAGWHRWAQFLRLRDLKPGTTVYYRMGFIDPKTERETRSATFTLTPRKKDGAVRVPDEVPGPPFILDRPNTTYVLTREVAADGTVFVITAPNVTLDLDGHTVFFGMNSAEQVHGVLVKNTGRATICNGHIVQGARSKEYSSAVESRWRDAPTEIFGISTFVHLRCAYPIKFLGKAANVDIHHNLLESYVTEIESRHYPGNDLLRLDISGGNVHVHDNLLTEGCHVGIRLAGAGPNVEVDHNDIRHHMQYVNGYALAISCPGADVHHNRVTSCGRGAHLVAEGIQFHDNHLDLTGHQVLDDMPQRSRPWKQILVELHGIKLEDGKVRNCRVFRNFVRIVQRLPHDSDGQGTISERSESGIYIGSKATSLAADRLVDTARQWEKDRWRGYFVKYAADLPPAAITGNDATTLFGQFQARPPAEYRIYAKWTHVPATPLNFGADDPNAMNEVYENTFVALTDYRKTRHGGYGDSGQWATGIYFVGMNHGPAQPGKYAAFIHDNRFLSNDLFVGAESPVNMTLRIERNSFAVAKDPPPTAGRTPFWRIGADLEKQIRSGANVLDATEP